MTALVDLAVWIVAIGSLAIIAANVVVMPRLDRARPDRGGTGRLPPSVSVLIPARDEQDDIVACLRAVLAQRDVELDVVVLDDRSGDDTLALARGVIDDRVRVVAGEPLPDGWTGKNWACHQLSELATHDLWCFVDADTVLEPHVLAEVCDLIERDGADLMSCLIGADYRSTSQRVLLPMVNHALLALFPISLMHTSRLPSVALALGPFIAVRREAYDRVGGHAAHPAEIVDDVRLARGVKRSGGRVRLANGASAIRTRWYPDVASIWRGFSKNAYGAIESSPVLAVLTCGVLVPLLLTPFVRVAAGAVVGDVRLDALAQVTLLILGRVITARLGRDPVWSSILHPIAVVFWGATLAQSARLAHLERSVEWRGRSVSVGRR